MSSKTGPATPRRARLEVLETSRRPDLPPSARPHWVRIVAANGEILAHTEQYSNRANAKRAAKSLVAAFLDIIEDQQ